MDKAQRGEERQGGRWTSAPDDADPVVRVTTVLDSAVKDFFPATGRQRPDPTNAPGDVRLAAERVCAAMDTGRAPDETDLAEMSRWLWGADLSEGGSWPL